MTDEQLREANKIKDEISRVERFIWRAEKTWTGKLSIRKPFMFFKSHAYGAIDSAEYEMDTEMKNRVLNVVRERLKELKTKLESM